MAENNNLIIVIVSIVAIVGIVALVLGMNSGSAPVYVPANSGVSAPTNVVGNAGGGWDCQNVVSLELMKEDGFRSAWKCNFGSMTCTTVFYDDGSQSSPRCTDSGSLF